MRFLLLTTSYPSPARPLAGTYNRDLAEALAGEHEVKVVAPVTWPDAILAALRGARASARTATAAPALEVLRPLYLYTPRVFRNHYGLFMRASVRGALRSLFARFRPDVVIGYWAHPDGEAAVAAARESDAVALVVVGGSDVLLLPRDPGRRRAILKVLRSADAVLAVGSALRERVIEMGIPAQRVHVFEQGVDARFNPGDRGAARRRIGLPPDDRIVLWVGRMVEVKALDVLIAAGARLRARGSTFQLYFVGDGPLAERVRAWIREARGEDVMHVIGPVEHARLPDWYRAADLTVLSSRSEGVPNVLRESLACGTPFVATSVGGIPELVREPSLIVPPDDPEALADAIHRGLSSVAASTRPPGQSSWADAASSIAALVRSLRENTAQPARNSG